MKTHDTVEPYARFASTAPRALAIAIVGGAGYVGTVTAVGLAHLGHEVTAVDIAADRLAQLRRGLSPWHEPGLAPLLGAALERRALTFSDDLAAALQKARIVFIAVNTPRRENGEADLSHVITVASALGRHLQPRTTIVVKSTVPVGSHLTIQRVLQEYGRHEGEDYDLVSNPEFLGEGSAVRDFFFPDRVVIGGESPRGIALVRELFEPLGAPILETSIKNAQMVKYASNAFLAMRVSFINEIANICERLGADIGPVVEGLGFDRRIGHGYLRPGIGFSGPCLPKDLEGLIRLAEDAGYEPFLLKAILEKNRHQHRWILGKVTSMLGASLYGRRIGILGLVFKPGTSDTRNSAATAVAGDLQHRGAEVRCFDPMVEEEQGVPGRLVRSPYAAAEGADLLVLLTAWPEFASLDFTRIRALMREPNIVDGVNALDPQVVRGLGFAYTSVGRP